MTKSNIVAIILAAGYSSRFQGAFKPLATISSKPVLEHAVNLFQTADIKDIVVVVGHRWAAMGHKLSRLPVKVVINENYAQGMFSSIKTGVENLPGHAEAFFLLPVDICLVRPSTILALIRAQRQNKAEILHPVFMEKRGHPPLVGRRIARAIGVWGGDGGLSSLLEQYEDYSADVPVADEFIHLDLDTRSDLLRLRKRYQRYDIPTEQECIALQRLWNVPGLVIAHCRTVARVADILAEALNNAGCRLDTDLLHAVALLHDCAKGLPDHAKTGAGLLADAGLKKTADIVERHMDVVFEDSEMLNESHILYLADKLVENTTLVTLDERLHIMLTRFRGSARQVAIYRLAKAQNIGKRVETLIGVSLTSVLSTGNWKLSGKQQSLIP